MKPASEKPGLKALLCDSSPNWGGQQYRLVREALWMKVQGHEVLVLCGARSALAARMRKHAPHIPVETIRSWGGPLALLEFVWKTARATPDIIHTHSGQDALWAILFHFAGRTVVHSCHMTVPPEMKARRKFPYRSGCSRTIASAAFIKRDLGLITGIPEDRVDVVGEGVDLNQFHPGVSGSGFRSEFGIPEEAPLFGMVAMIRGDKGHKHFLKAAAEVLEKFPSARFVIAGDGPESQVEKLTRRVQKEFPQHPSPIILAGYREDVPEILAALDALVVPSLKEAQTIVIPQAFATGKPVIASRVGGIPEIVTHEVNGWLVPAGDDRALADAMMRFAESPDLRLRLGRAGLDLARRELGFDRKMELVIASYRRAIGRICIGMGPAQKFRGGGLPES